MRILVHNEVHTSSSRKLGFHHYLLIAKIISDLNNAFLIATVPARRLAAAIQIIEPAFCVQRKQVVNTNLDASLSLECVRIRYAAVNRQQKLPVIFRQCEVVLLLELS